MTLLKSVEIFIFQYIFPTNFLSAVNQLQGKFISIKNTHVHSIHVYVKLECKHEKTEKHRGGITGETQPYVPKIHEAQIHLLFILLFLFSNCMYKRRMASNEVFLTNCKGNTKFQFYFVGAVFTYRLNVISVFGVDIKNYN